MSGFEIVGVILGVAPLVLSSIDYWKSGITGKEMRQLERRFKTQHNIFLNTIEEIFSPFVSDGQLVKLLKNPKGPTWQDPQMSGRLKEHLGESYESFEGIVEDVKDMMIELQESLNTKASRSQCQEARSQTH